MGYFAVTGIWPLVSMPSFEWLTGLKTDRWLVKTVGALVGVVGGMLALAGPRGHRSPEVAPPGAGSALRLAAVDTIYALRAARADRLHLPARRYRRARDRRRMGRGLGTGLPPYDLKRAAAGGTAPGVHGVGESGRRRHARW